MDTKTTAIVAHITLIGWLVAYLSGDKEGAKFYLNQTLVLILFSLLSAIPCIGFLWAIFLLVCWIISLVGAIHEEEKVIPLLGSIHILK